MMFGNAMGLLCSVATLSATAAVSTCDVVGLVQNAVRVAAHDVDVVGDDINAKDAVGDDINAKELQTVWRSLGGVSLPPNSGRSDPSAWDVDWKVWYDKFLEEFPHLTFSNYGFVQPEGTLDACAVNTTLPYQANLYAALTKDIDLKGLDVLDVGSGRGAGAAMLAECHCPVRMVGLDISAAQTAQAKLDLEKAPSKCALEFVQGDAMKLPFADHSFDVILSVEAFHGFTDFDRFVTEAKRVLRPGGRFLLAGFRNRDGLDDMTRLLTKRVGKPIQREDLTNGVLAAMQKYLFAFVEYRLADMSAPKRELLSNFMGGEHSYITEAMQSRKAAYVKYDVTM